MVEALPWCPRDYAPSVPGGILSENYGLTEAEQNKAENLTESRAGNRVEGNAENDASPDFLDNIDGDEKDPTQSVA